MSNDKEMIFELGSDLSSVWLRGAASAQNHDQLRNHINILETACWLTLSSIAANKIKQGIADTEDPQAYAFNSNPMFAKLIVDDLNAIESGQTQMVEPGDEVPTDA